jgi:hypothetical protein
VALKQIVTVGPLAAAVANYFVTSRTPTAGQSLPLVHTAAPSGVPQRVQGAYGDEGGARTLALTGTNFEGVTIQETLAIPSGVSGGGTVTSLQDFATLTSVVAGGGAWTTNVTLGTCNIASSPWQRISEHLTPVNIGVNVVVNGTVNYTVETTNDALDPPSATSAAGAPFGRNGPIPPIPTPFPVIALQGLSANGTGEIAQPISSWRITLNSGSGSATATGIQGGIKQGS